jgi:hypothetical protein
MLSKQGIQTVPKQRLDWKGWMIWYRKTTVRPRENTQKDVKLTQKTHEQWRFVYDDRLASVNRRLLPNCVRTYGSRVYKNVMGRLIGWTIAACGKRIAKLASACTYGQEYVGKFVNRASVGWCR